MILMYHNVVADTAPAGFRLQAITLPLSAFTRQMNFLNSLFRIISLSEYIGRLESGKGIKWNEIAITFDDGTYATFENVYPLAEAKKIPMTIFVCTGQMNGGPVIWGSFINAVTCESIYPSLEIGGKVFELNSMEERMFAQKQLIRHVISQPDPEAFIETYREKYPLPAEILEHYKGMASSQILRAADSEFLDIGSHTVSHPFLSRLSKEKQEEELRRSKDVLEKDMGCKLDFFAYPSGDYSPETLELITACGYRAAFAVESKKLGKKPLLEFPRSGIYSKSRLKLFLKVLKAKMNL